jgi:hypothetical protein
LRLTQKLILEVNDGDQDELLPERKLLVSLLQMYRQKGPPQVFGTGRFKV